MWVMPWCNQVSQTTNMTLMHLPSLPDNTTSKGELFAPEEVDARHAEMLSGVSNHLHDTNAFCNSYQTTQHQKSSFLFLFRSPCAVHAHLRWRTAYV
jgi:hypothetical protein